MNTNYLRMAFLLLKQPTFNVSLAFFLLMFASKVCAETIIYDDHKKTHLRYTLNPETREAMVGDGTSDEHNARAFPPYGDPYWSDPTLNYWKNVAVPETITYNNITYSVVGITQNAFYKETYMRTIQLPNTIKSIGGEAFYFAVNLESINLPEGIKSIPFGAFNFCKSLQSITLPSTITSIGSYAFFECRRLKELTIPSNCRSIGDEAFSWCDSITTLIIEDGTAPISFGYAHDLPLENIPGIFYIKAFYRGQFANSPLQNIYLGRNIQKTTSAFGDLYSPFESCGVNVQSETTQNVSHSGHAMNQVIFGPMVTYIPDFLFPKYATVTEDIVLPTNVQVIKSLPTFDYKSTQNTLAIPETCDSLCVDILSRTYIDLSKIICYKATPPYVTNPFRPNDNLVIDVPAGAGEAYRNHETWGRFMIIDPSDTLVTVNVRYPGSLYGRLVYEDLDVTQIYRLKLTGSLNASDWEVVNTMTRMYDLDLSELSEGPEAAGVTLTNHLVYYREANTRNELTLSELRHIQLPDTFYVPATCTKIRANAFRGQPTRHVVVQGPTVLEKGALNSTNLRSVEIMGFGADVMLGAVSSQNLTKVTIGKGIVVRENAFSCPNLKEVILADSITYLGDMAFGNAQLENVVIDGHIGYIGSNIFVSSKKSLKNLYINRLDEWCKLKFSSHDENPISMAAHVFIHNEEVDSLCIPAEIQSLHQYAFAGYKNLKKISFIGGKDSIGTAAFDSCPNLESVVFANSIKYLGKSSFSHCTKLKSVIFLSEGLNEIPDSCFFGDESLESVKLNKGIKQIKRSAFAKCSSLATIVLPPTTTEIGDMAFEGCSSLSTLSFPISITEIGDNAFINCSNLKSLKALWVEPITIDANSFNGISNRCILWVPFGTVGKYYAAGWGHIPLIEEGFYQFTIDPGTNGTVNCGDFSANTILDGFMIDMEEVPDSLVLTIEPDSSYYVASLVLDSMDITSHMTLKNDKIRITDIQNNHSLSVQFNRFFLGDVNADDYVDVGDISAIVNNIQQRPVSEFIAEAADVNFDKEIDVGDIAGTVNIIYEDANLTVRAPRREIRSSALYEIWTDETVHVRNGDISIPVYMNQGTDISGFQMELVLPDNVYVSVSDDGNYMIEPNSTRLGQMNIFDVTRLPNNHYQILCSSTQNVTINDSQEGVMDITLHVDAQSSINELELHLENIRIADRNGNVYHHELETILRLEEKDTPTGIIMTEEDISAKKYIKDGEFFILKGNKKYTILGTSK